MSRCQIAKEIAMMVAASLASVFAMFLMGLAFGRSLEATVHGSLAAGFYLFAGLFVGRLGWRWMFE